MPGPIPERVLVNGFQNACDREVILELDSDRLVSEGFEDRENKLILVLSVSSHTSERQSSPWMRWRRGCWRVDRNERQANSACVCLASPSKQATRQHRQPYLPPPRPQPEASFPASACCWIRGIYSVSSTRPAEYLLWSPSTLIIIHFNTSDRTISARNADDPMATDNPAARVK